jgi:hypothetical protein
MTIVGTSTRVETTDNAVIINPDGFPMAVAAGGATPAASTRTIDILTCTIPVGATTAAVSVTTPEGTAIGPVFEIGDPIIELLMPAEVTKISQTAFDELDPAAKSAIDPLMVVAVGKRLVAPIYFENEEMQSMAVSSEQVIFYIPRAKLKTGYARCLGSNSVQLKVKVIKEDPEIISFSVEKAKFRNQVTITGKNFGPAHPQSKLLLNSNPIETLTWTDTTITIYIDDYKISGDVQVVRFDE